MYTVKARAITTRLVGYVALFSGSLCFIPIGTSIAAPSKPPCDIEVCFVNDDAKREYERQNNCVAVNRCDYAVQRVQEVRKTIPANDPTYGFYRNQDCIANKSCKEKAQLDNPTWLDHVVYDFITPLVEEEGEWKEKKQQCNTLWIGAGIRCQQIMAEYHISEDLQNSVNRNGCGTQEDWDQIGVWLKECVDKGVEEDVARGLQSAASAYASYVVAGERKKVRDACIRYRSGRGLSLESQL